MELSRYAIQQIVPIIIGKEGDDWYKKGSQLVDWFNKYGARDVYDRLGLPPNPYNKDQRMSRTQYAINTLTRFNNTDKLKSLLEEYINNNSNCIDTLNEIIKPEELKIEQFAGGYHIVGCDGKSKNTGVTDAHFEELQNHVISCLRNAELTIYVAMAWFTNQKIADVLKEKSKDILDIKLVIHRDYTNEEHGVDLNGLCYRYRKAPNGGTMHDKFCVIDNRMVLTDSYNWSIKAETKNEENILTDTHPDTVLKYAIKFKKLFLED